MYACSGSFTYFTFCIRDLNFWSLELKFLRCDIVTKNLVAEPVAERTSLQECENWPHTTNVIFCSLDARCLNSSATEVKVHCMLVQTTNNIHVKHLKKSHHRACFSHGFLHIPQYLVTNSSEAAFTLSTCALTVNTDTKKNLLLLFDN